MENSICFEFHLFYCCCGNATNRNR